MEKWKDGKIEGWKDGYDGMAFLGHHMSHM